MAEALAAPKDAAFSGRTGATPWSPSLGTEMERAGRVVHEEAVFADLAQDLARRADDTG